MTHLRFNQVFLALMGLSFVSAFLLPTRYTDRVRAPFEGLFVPVSSPTRHLANWIRGKWVNDQEIDPRPTQTLSQENLALRVEVARLQGEIKRLEQLAGERASLGDLNSLCLRLSVTGTDSGSREGLTVSGWSLGDVHENQPVLFSAGQTGKILAGQIDSAGPTAAHVRLITDAGFTLTGRFIRFVRDGDSIKVAPVGDLPAIVQGIGGGAMDITTLSMDQVKHAGIQTDDWVVLADPTWPAAVQNILLGRVQSVRPQRKSLQHAEIRLAPETSLMRLNDVWVMTR